MASQEGERVFRVGVVPEHFSLPLHHGVEKNIFEKDHVKVALDVYARGTGSMCRALRSGELDIAVALTEGVVSDILSHGPGICILATYVESPLHWQLSVAADSPLQSVDELRGQPIGISRFGSGSHLMAFMLADQRKWDLDRDLKFVVKGGLPDLLGGIADGSIKSFLWETFTSKPYSDRIRKLGEVLTPWPCFVIAVRSDLVASHPDALRRFVAAVRHSCADFAQDPNMIATISRECHLSPEDARLWFDQTKFSADGHVSNKVLEDTMATLLRTGATSRVVDPSELQCPLTVGQGQ